MKLPFINQEVEHYTLNCGLNVYIVNDFSSNENTVNFLTNFGSNDLENNKLSKGVAHYLEHVMFAHENGDYFDLYKKYNASANAYTSYNCTNYLFSTSQNFYECLEILIDQVTTISFTQKSVDKELEIISEEILMYDEMPAWKIRNLAFSSICEDTNYKNDIAGTIDSIKEIDFKMLCDIHDTYYNFNNQVMVIYSNEKGTDIRDFLNEKLPNKAGLKNSTKIVESTLNIKKLNYEIIKTLDTQHAISFIKFKCNKFDYMDYLSLKVYLDSFFSDMNDDFVLLKNENKISETMSYNLYYENDIRCIMFDYVDDECEVLHDYLIEHFRKNPDLNNIALSIKKVQSSAFYQTKDLSNFSNVILRLLSSNIDLDKYYSCFEKLSVEEVIKRSNYCLENFTTGQVVLKGENKNDKEL